MLRSLPRAALAALTLLPLLAFVARGQEAGEPLSFGLEPVVRVTCPHCVAHGL